MEPALPARDPNIVESGLSRSITLHGVTVEVRIYRLEKSMVQGTVLVA